MAKVYTKTGDRGQTGLLSGDRVAKDDIRIECMGAVDEANSSIGLLRAKLDLEHSWQARLQRIQSELMNCMSHIGVPFSEDKDNLPPLPVESAVWAEAWMDDIEQNLGEASKYFLLPAGDEASALCHVIRTQIRKAERRIITLDKSDAVDPVIMIYINRLSDLFFMLAREALCRSGIPEEKWNLFRCKTIKDI